MAKGKTNWSHDWDSKRGGLGFRVWTLNKKSFIKGVVVPWTTRILKSNVVPLKDNQAGVYAITDLDEFFGRNGGNINPLSVFGIVRWGGKTQEHRSEHVVRADNAMILYLAVSSKLLEADPEIPSFLSDYYRVPVGVFSSNEELRQLLLDAVFNLEGSLQVPMKLDDWMKYQEGIKEDTVKDSTGSYGARDNEKAAIEDILVHRVKQAHLEHRDKYNSDFYTTPTQELFLYRVDCDSNEQPTGKIKLVETGPILKIKSRISAISGPVYLLISRHKLSDKFTNLSSNYSSLSSLPVEELMFVDESGNRTRIKNFMKDFDSFYVSGDLTPVNELLDYTSKGKADTTFRNKHVLEYLNPESQENVLKTSENLKPFLTKKDSSEVNQTWRGSDLNKRVLVFGYLLGEAGGNSLVGSSPDYLPEEFLDNFEVDDTLDGFIKDKKTGKAMSIQQARKEIREWKESGGNRIGLEALED